MPIPSTQTWRRVIALALAVSIAILVSHLVFVEHNPIIGHGALLFFTLVAQIVCLWLVWFGLGTADQERIQQEQQNQRYAQRLNILREISHLLNSSLDTQVVLTTLLDQLGRLVQSDSVSLLYITPTGMELVAYKQEDNPEWQFQQLIVPPSPIELWMLKSHQPVLVEDTRRHPLWEGRVNTRPIGSWLGTPMMVQGEVVGFINLSKQEHNFYTTRDLEVVVTFASQAATAVHNARLFEQVQRELEERKRVEQALHTSQQQFRTLFETMTQGVIFRDATGVTAINPAAEELTGLSLAELQEEYTGSIKWPAMYEDGTLMPVAEYATSVALHTGQPVHNQLMGYFNPRKQEYRWMLVDAIPQFRAGEEKPFEVYAILKDVTQSKQYERALLESETRFRTLFETISHGVIYFEANGRMIAANPAAYAIMGNVILSPNRLNRDDFVQDPDLLILNEEGQPLDNYDDLVQASFISGQTLHNLVIGFQPKGQEWVQWLQMEIVPIFEQKRHPEHEASIPYQVYTVFQDITAQKQAEEALRQTQKLESLGILAGGIAHDFNNLLVALLGQSSLALQKLGNEHLAAKHIRKVIQAAEHAAGLTRQMLAFSGRGQFQIQAVNLNEVITQNLPLLQVAIPKTVQISTNLHPNLPFIEADQSQMQQIVMNLVLNGAEAADKEGGKVTLVTDIHEIEPLNVSYWQLPNSPIQPGVYVRLEVHDNGVGISSEQKQKIFDPFYTTKLTGRGLGLAAVLGIVRGHKGGLRVQSEVGQGTTFTLLLPSATTTASNPVPVALAESTASEDKSTPLQGHILIIDDELGVREALQDILENAGLTTVCAANGREGLLLYQSQQTSIDLVILDLSMPGLTGMETLTALRAFNPQVPVLLSSGYNQGEALADEPLPQRVGFVQKPYSNEQLLEIVGRTLRAL